MLTKETKKTIQRFYNYSHSSYEEAKHFFEVQATLLFLDYLSGEESKIPFIGSLKVEHVGNEITKKGKKEAKLAITIEPDDFLKKIIGQEEDGDTTEIQKMLQKRIKKSFEKIKD
jgi:hypothetical protein